MSRFGVGPGGCGPQRVGCGRWNSGGVCEECKNDETTLTEEGQRERTVSPGMPVEVRTLEGQHTDPLVGGDRVSDCIQDSG